MGATGADEEEEDLDALLDKYSVEAAAQNERDAARCVLPWRMGE